MRILLAPNAFKGSLSAREVSAIIAARLSSRHEIIQCPLADGGDGTLSVLKERLLDFAPIRLSVCGPFLGTKIIAEYLWCAKRCEAFIELALASGLALTTPDKRNPEDASSFGTGELIADAIARGATLIRIAIGGSATNDAAIGSLAALGFKFLGKGGSLLPPIGRSLAEIATIQRSPVELPKFEVLCDVNNPLYGTNGAAYVYGPQKGADPAMVQRLDGGLQNIHKVILRDFGVDINFPGAGAAGGFGGGAKFGLNAALVSGFECVAKLVGLEQAVHACDLVVTGEGRVDNQSLQGKVLSGVLSLARRHSKPVAIIAGGCELAPTEGIVAIYQLLDDARDIDDAISRTPALLQAQADKLLKFLN